MVDFSSIWRGNGCDREAIVQSVAVWNGLHRTIAVSRVDKRIQQVIGEPHVAIDDRKDQDLNAFVKR